MIELYYENYILINIEIPKFEEINVITLIATDKTIKFTGYKSLKGIKENLEKSRQIVETINMKINIR